jgi:phosphoribosylanthranilate isomerase
MRRVDVEAAIDNGADAVGFVVGTPTARRNLQLDAARKLMRNVPILTSRIAVTTTLNLKLLERIYKTLTPDALQLHKYDQNTVRMLHRKNPELKIIISTPIRDQQSIFEAEEIAKSSDAIHADTPSRVASGGTGETHDWKLTAQLRKRIYPHPLILAGGLNATNVRFAIRTVQPYAVDVSSGVEAAIGVKDHHEMKMFIKNAKGDTA